MTLRIGRPKKMTPFLSRKVVLLAEYGLTEEQIGEVLGISTDTILRAKKDQEFCGALKDAKEKADLAVINALYKRAVGMTIIERRIVNGLEMVVEKHLPPDTTACIFWLKNRSPNEWRDRSFSSQDERDSKPALIRLFKPINDKEQERVKAGESSIDVLFGKDFVEKIRREENLDGNG